MKIIVRTGLLSFMLFILVSCGSSELPYYGAFIKEKRDLIELPQFLGPAKNDDYESVPTISNQQPTILLWYPDINIQYLVLITFSDGGTVYEFNVNPAKQDGVLEIVSKEELLPDRYCLVQGDPLGVPTSIIHWCFRVMGDDQAKDMGQNEEASSDATNQTDESTLNAQDEKSIPSPKEEAQSVIDEYLTGFDSISTDEFNTLGINWRELQDQTARLNGGVVEIQGKPNWLGILYNNRKLREGKGMMIDLKKIKGNDFVLKIETGTWDMDSYRQFGIHGGIQPTGDYWEGKRSFGGLGTSTGNLTLSTDEWATIMIAIHDDGEFLAVVWDKNDPSNRVSFHEQLGKEWASKTWTFVAQMNNGTTINIDNYTEFSFGSIK